MATDAPAKQMLADELKKHPEYPHVNWPLEARKQGKVSVARERGGPFFLHYEVHGNGPICIVWIMGMGSLRNLWQRQTKDFGHTKGDKYTCLIFDNRGMGDSDKPLMRYSTSEMAKDTLELVDSLGWTGKRRFHAVGASMGGMIAQELALLIPERIASLTLVCTAARLVNTIGYFENLRNRINIFIPKSIDNQIADVKRNMYSDSFLAKPDESEYEVEPFPTNGDRFGAYELTKRSNPSNFTRTGFLAQAVAVGWHHKSAEQLKELGDRVGRNRIQIIHGGADRLITFPHAEVLLKELGGEEGGVTKHFVEGQGHGILLEMRHDFRGWMEEFVDTAEKLNSIET